jgi:hypothetical protein
MEAMRPQPSTAACSHWLEGFLGGYASVSKCRDNERRYLLLSWRRGFVVSRLEG